MVTILCMLVENQEASYSLVIVLIPFVSKNLTTQNIIFSVWLDLVFYHPTLLNTKFQFFDN